MHIAIALHVLSVVVWVGGMFFAYMVLRPAAADLFEAPLRLTLWARVLARFFVWVWVAVVTLLLTGYGLIFTVFGGMKGSPIYVHVMQVIGWIMMALYAHVYFAPYRRLVRAVMAQDWETGGRQLRQIRRVIGLNLILGLLVIIVASGGRYL